MSKNGDGKPTAFQIEALKKAGIAKNSLKGIKTYRDAENALKRIKRAKDLMAKSEPVNLKKGDEFKANGKKYVCEKGGKKPICKPVAKKPVAKKAEKPMKRIAGLGVFKVRITKADVIEALMMGLAKSVIAVLGGGECDSHCAHHSQGCKANKAKKA